MWATDMNSMFYCPPHTTDSNLEL